MVQNARISKKPNRGAETEDHMLPLWTATTNQTTAVGLRTKVESIDWVSLCLNYKSMKVEIRCLFN